MALCACLLLGGVTLVWMLARKRPIGSDISPDGVFRADYAYRVRSPVELIFGPWINPRLILEIVRHAHRQCRFKRGGARRLRRAFGGASVLCEKCAMDPKRTMNALTAMQADCKEPRRSLPMEHIKALLAAAALRRWHRNLSVMKQTCVITFAAIFLTTAVYAAPKSYPADSHEPGTLVLLGSPSRLMPLLISRR